ncbi:MAG: DUF3365 domain-containing protein [Deltaproteobacteria bacterium]|nr:DUF3365 domain-containing protein [Deltaproteobacteria bacterium]
MTRRHLSLQRKFLLGITLIVFPTISAIFIWSGIHQRKQAMDQVINQARILARQIILTRQWISDCGGVMVLMGTKGAEGASCFYDERLETPGGSFQRFTPSMVTARLSQYSYHQNMYRFRLASLHPLNPKNSPDKFEKEALARFRHSGVKELFQIQRTRRKEYLHYMVPLFMDKTCLQCHAKQGYTAGSIGGGLSIFLPVDHMKAVLARNNLQLAAAGVGFIFLTVLTLFFLLRRMVIKPMQELEIMTAHVGKGNFNARVNISTGDEVEKLAHAFNAMAERLSKGRDVLEERIRQATRELSEANRELQTLDDLKSEFLANMSHELRSPLTVIRGGVDYLNRTIKGAENRRYLAIIDKNIARLIRLVSDLFDITRIEAGKVDWAFDREDIAGLIEEVTQIIRPLADEKDLSILYEHPGPIFASIDLERIEQVLVNLIENAIKFSDQGSQIAITVEEDDDTVLVSIKDQGPGIPRDDLEAIFRKFHTVPSSGLDGKREGTGLGLAICKSVIEAHKGKIWAESEEGKGSTFFFRFPKSQSL